MILAKNVASLRTHETSVTPAVEEIKPAVVKPLEVEQASPIQGDEQQLQLDTGRDVHEDPIASGFDQQEVVAAALIEEKPAEVQPQAEEEKFEIDSEPEQPTKIEAEQTGAA